MFALFRFRRGQIRGIDFAISMLIFILTMTQVLTLTITFIDNSRSFQSTSARLNEATNIADSIFTSTGNYGTIVDWSSVTTANLQTGWKFGLADNESRIDPFKLNRLADNNDPTYALTYADIKSGMNITKDFRIELKSTINVSISSITEVAGGLTIAGIVEKNDFGLPDAEIWLFVYEEVGNGVVQKYLKTDSSGSFTFTLNPPNFATSNFFVVTAIAQFGVGNQDVDYVVYTKTGGTAPTINTQSLFRSTATTNGYRIEVRSTKIGNTAANVKYTTFYPSLGTKNHTLVAGTPVAQADNTWALDIPVPTDGVVGILSHEVVGGVHYIGYSVFPVILDNEVSGVVEPANLPSTPTTVIDLIVVVRQVIMELTFTVWE